MMTGKPMPKERRAETVCLQDCEEEDSTQKVRAFYCFNLISFTFFSHLKLKFLKKSFETAKLRIRTFKMSRMTHVLHVFSQEP